MVAFSDGKPDSTFPENALSPAMTFNHVANPTYTAPRESTGRIWLPRQTKALPSQPLNQIAGSSKSRSNQASGERALRCQPAAHAKMASLPYQTAAKAGTTASERSESDCAAANAAAARGQAPPARISGMK